jgi:hypothetical protein
VLSEAAWTHSRPAKAAVPRARQSVVAAIAEKARHRLSARYRKLIQHFCNHLLNVSAKAIM